MQRDPTPGSWVRAARQLGWTAPSLQQAMHFHHVAFLALPFYANPPPHPLIFKCESAAPLPKSALCWGTSVPHTPLKASARGKPGRDGYSHSCCPPWGPTGLPPSQPAKETHSHQAWPQADPFRAMHCAPLPTHLCLSPRGTNPHTWDRGDQGKQENCSRNKPLHRLPQITGQCSGCKLHNIKQQRASPARVTAREHSSEQWDTASPTENPTHRLSQTPPCRSPSLPTTHSICTTALLTHWSCFAACLQKQRLLCCTTKLCHEAQKKATEIIIFCFMFGYDLH